MGAVRAKQAKMDKNGRKTRIKAPLFLHIGCGLSLMDHDTNDTCTGKYYEYGRYGRGCCR